VVALQPYRASPMTAAKPPARQRAVSALASGFAAAELHHAEGRDLGRALGARHSARYLAAYEYRFNRRADLKSMVPRLAYVALRQPPTPYRTLVPAEKSG
ncbi:MAG: hypothetical protein U1E60_00105, partial [Reyranellaceae bacterium]